MTDDCQVAYEAAKSKLRKFEGSAIYEDMVQEFVLAYVSKADKPFARTFAYRKSLDWLNKTYGKPGTDKRKASSPGHLDPDDALEDLVVPPEPVTTYADEVKSAITTLDAESQELVQMLLAGLSVREVSRRLGVSVGGAYARLRHIRRDVGTIMASAKLQTSGGWFDLVFAAAKALPDPEKRKLIQVLQSTDAQPPRQLPVETALAVVDPDLSCAAVLPSDQEMRKLRGKLMWVYGYLRDARVRLAWKIMHVLSYAPSTVAGIVAELHSNGIVATHAYVTAILTDTYGDEGGKPAPFAKVRNGGDDVWMLCHTDIRLWSIEFLLRFADTGKPIKDILGFCERDPEAAPDIKVLKNYLQRHEMIAPDQTFQWAP